VAAEWSERKLESTYKEVLDAMVVFHEKGSAAACKKKLPLMPSFTSRLYAWEHELFTGLFLEERMGMRGRKIDAVRKDLAAVSRRLLKLPRVLVHRDLQSSNIMMKENRWSLIDFQGMRLGPAVYDLASFLCDPYIKINGAVRERLLYHYAQRANDASVCDFFWYGVIQRLAQALGAYARLGKNSGTAHFTAHIQPALLNVKQALKYAGGFSALEDVVEASLDRET